MASTHPTLTLWIGPKHSGKTTSAGQLVERARGKGITTAGILAPSVYRVGELIGFDVIDIHTGGRVPLARRELASAQRVGSFGMAPEGIEFGNAALNSPVARSAELVIVDEFGPLELQGDGWRPAVDSLIDLAQGTILLVVRMTLVAQVSGLYAELQPQILPGLEPASIDRVIETCRSRRFDASKRNQ